MWLPTFVLVAIVLFLRHVFVFCTISIPATIQFRIILICWHNDISHFRFGHFLLEKFYNAFNNALGVSVVIVCKYSAGFLFFQDEQYFVFSFNKLLC